MTLYPKMPIYLIQYFNKKIKFEIKYINKKYVNLLKLRIKQTFILLKIKNIKSSVLHILTIIQKNRLNYRFNLVPYIILG
jgi:hypothetical protein